MSVSDDLYVYYYSGGTKYYVYASSNDNNFYGTTDTNNATVFNFKQNSNLANNSWYLTFTPPVFDNRTLVRFMGNIIQETESDTQINSLYGKSLGSEGNQLQGSYLRTDQSPTIMPSTSDIAFTEYIIQGGTTDFYTEFIDSNVPTFSSIALNTLNTILTITFSESVYNTNGGSGDLETSDFTVQLSGGNASSPSLTAISKTNQSVWQLSLSYTGTPNGSETLTIEPASSSIYDAAGNAASTSQSNNTTNLNPFPTISSTVLSSNNTTLTVTFSEGVYNTSGGSGDLETSDFTLTLSGGVAHSPTISNISKTNELIWVLTISFTGDSDGTEILTVNPASTTSIYNSVGNAASTSQSNNTAILNDITVPTINTLTISSNNSIKTNYAGENDIVTLYIIASENIIEPTVVFQSNGEDVTNAVSYSGAGTSWTAQYTVSSDDTNGVISFVLNIEDEVGNQLNGTNATTDSSSVTKVGNSSVLTYTSTTAGDQVGSTKLGNAQSSAGTGIAISGDGKKMAVPAYQNRDAPAGNYAGAMQVWEYNSSTEDWDTFGSDGTKTDGFIYGKQSFGEAGTGYAMNKAGDIVVLGEPKNDTDGNVSQANFDGTNTGKVHVYKYNSNNDLWEQMGDDIIGKNNSEFSGISVSINAIGNIIVIGSPGGNSAAGLVRVYKYSDISVTNGTWEQLGGDTTGDIEGVNSNEESGHSVSLNSDGDIVAVGAPQYGTGRVRIWKYSDISVTNGTWTQLSTDIVGSKSNGKTGFSVSLNDVGDIIAIGSPYANNNAGEVSVYQYSDISITNGSWTKLSGNNITGSGLFGDEVSLNGQGNMVAIGAPNSHKAYVYEYSDLSITNGTWSEILELSGSNDNFGSGVALNTSGSYVAVGAQQNTGGAGAGFVYETGVQTTVTTFIHAVPPDLVSDSLSIVSNNSNTTKAKATDEVTLSFEYDLSINTPTVSFQSNGQDIADTSITYAGTNDNTSWTAKYTVDSSDTDGSVTFTIDATAQTTTTDATQLTQSDITDGTNVTVDTTVPTITNTVISNDNLNLSVTVSEKIAGNSTYSDTTMVFNVTVNGDFNGGGNYIISGGNITDSTQTNHAINCYAGQTIIFSMATTDYNTYKLGIGDGPNYIQVTSINLDDTDSRFSTTVDGDNTLISFTPTENSSEWHYYCAQDPYPQGWGAQITVSNGIETTDFTLSLTGGSSATLQSNTPTNISTLDNLTYDMSLNISGTATGEETLTIVPASSTSIYDAVGNAMSTTQSNNSVNLTDLALPTINTLTISSNNSIKTNYAGENDIVTLYITASEDIIEPTVVFKSNDVEITNTVSYSGSGTIWTAQYTVSSDDTNGVISFVLDIEDVAGNTNQRTLTTDSSSVTKVGSILHSTTTTTGTTVGNSRGFVTASAGSQSGFSTSINNDGTIVASGSYVYDSDGLSNNGRVQIYQWDGNGNDVTNWTEIGDFEGTNTLGRIGTSVSLNVDGTICVMGAPGYHSNIVGGSSNVIGKVWIYQYNSGTNWTNIGEISDPTGNTNTLFGFSVDINNEGNIIAVNATGSGISYIYQYDSGTTWTKIGELTTGTSELDSNTLPNASISLNNDGDVVAVGSTDHDNYKGKVSIYKYNSSTWDLLGSEIVGDTITWGNGTVVGRRIGLSVSLNGSGNRVAIGNNGISTGWIVYVYDYGDSTMTSTNSTWSLLENGTNDYIENTGGTNANNRFGTCLSINDAGNILAIGAHYYTYDDETNQGAACIYSYSNSSWTKEFTRYGENASDAFGFSISLNGSGSVFSTGARLYDYSHNSNGEQNSAANGGIVYIYETGEDTEITTTPISYTLIPPDLVSDSVSIVSNNTDTTKAKITDEITLSFEYDLSINTPMVSFFSNGVGITDTEIDYVGTNDNTSWTAKYTVDSADTDGAVTFTIDASAQTTLTDATQLTESDITDGTNVTVDTTIPTITGTTISSNNVNLQVTFSEFVVNNSSYTDAELSYTVTANGSLNYILNGSGLTDSAQPSISLFVGQTVTFSVSNSVNDFHPFKIGTVAESNDTNNIISTSDSRLTNTEDGDNNTLISFTPYDNGTFYYYCGSHSGMGNSIFVTGGLEPSDFTVEIAEGVATVAANPTGLSTTSNTIFDLTLDVTNASSADGNEVLTVKPTNATSIFDKVGNPMVVEQSNNTVNLNDKTLPTAAITYTLDGVASTGPFGDGDTVVIIATFDEDMLDSNNVNLIITGTGSVISETVTMTRVNATKYTYNYTPPVSQNGSATLQVSGGTDLAGNSVVNTPTSGDTFNIVNDTTPPTAAITYSYAGPYRNGGTNVTITATFNEDMADSPVPQIIITGAGIANVAATNMTKVNPTEYSFEYIIPTGDGTGTVTLSTGTDLAGNVITNVPTSGNTFTVDNTAPTISSTSLLADNSTITVTFSDNVYNAADDTRDDLETSDFALSITGDGIATLQSATPSSINKKSEQEYDLTINYTPGSVARGNEILKVVPLTASIFDLAGNAASDAQDNADNKVTLNDTEAPTVTSVTTTTAPGNYNDASPIIPIKITFSENVLVDTTNGTPQLTLSIGGSGHSIDYASGSNSSELIFNYTILDGHNETNLDYEGTGSLSFSGGTITDVAGNDADLALPAPGASGSISENKVIVIDTTHPNVLSVNSAKPDGSYRQGEVIDIEIEFTESVDVTGIPQLELELDGDNVLVDYASGSGSNTLVFQYTVVSNENSDNLDYSTTGSLTLNGGTIKDSANNDAARTLPSPGTTNSLGHNKNIVIDNTVPTVIDITATTENGTYRVGTVIPIEVFFSETVIVGGIPQITLAFDNGTKAVNYTDGSNSNRLVFNYAIESGENTNNLDYSTTGSLSFSGGTIKDVAGNDADLTLFSPAAPGSLGHNKQLAIDTTNPTVVSFTIDDSALKKSETATVTLEFSEAVSEFDSDVDITTTNGSLTKMTSPDNITWTGTFTPTDDSESSTNSLTLSNNYTDIVGNGGITATTANFSVDTLTASVTSFVLDDTSLIKGETATVLLVFSEPVSGFDSNTDITVQNGVLSQMTSSGNNSNWTGTFTPTDDIDDTTGLLTLADTYTDVAGNTGVSATTATFGVDTKLPTVVTFALANSALSSGSTTTVSLVFSEAVSGFNSNDDITTENGTLTQMTSDDNNITWTGTFTPSVDIEDTSNTLTLQTSLTDVAGNQIASQTYTSNYVIDTLIPRVNNVNASNAPGTYKEGDVIAIEVYFSETVNVTLASPYIVISVGGNTVNVNYTSGSSTNILTFEYTVPSGITETTGINYAASDSLKFNGAEIKDNYGNNALLDLPATDSANSLLGNKTILIDTTPATIDSVALAADNTYITVSFNENVFNTESGSGVLETTDFTLDITGGTANFSGGVTSSTPSNITVIDDKSFRLFMSFNGLPSGDEVVTVNPASNSIFDIAGNASTTTQTGNEVTLNDQALPILTTVEISSTNDSTNFAKVGDVVTLYVEANETLYNTPTIEFKSGGDTITNLNAVNIAGAPITDTFQFSYTIDANDTEGDITFKISNYIDRNSNVGVDVITLTSGSTITVDKVVPTLNSVTYSTSNSSALQSKVGDTITLDITASETINAPTVDFKTNGVTHTTQTMSGSGNSYTSSFVTSDSHADGDITFTISDISDQANNEGVNVNTVTSGNTLIFDKTAPTFSNLSLTSSNSVNTISKDTDVVTLVMTSSEDLTAPPTVLFKSGTTDLTTVTATQPDVSDDTQFSASFTVSNTHVDGEIAYVISNFTDVAGNAGTTYTENSSGVFIDNTSPTITSVAVDGNNTQIELTLSEEVYSNSNGSGALATIDVYLLLTGGTATLSYPYPSAITPIGDDLSRYTLTIDTILQGPVQGSEVITITPTVDSIYDSAGNVASVTQSNNTVQLNDTSLPSMTTVSISSDNGNPSLAKAGNTITLDLICDESVSVPTVSFYSGPNADDINGSVTITPDSGNNTTYRATYDVVSNDTDGNITFSVSNFQDANGNTGNAATIVTDSTSVTVDTTEPTFSSITMSSNNSVDDQYAKRNRTVTLYIEANENINTPTVSFTSDNAPINGSVTVAGADNSYTASFVVQHNDTDGLVGFEISNISDLTGNTASNISTLTSGSGVTIDKVAPSILSATIASNNDNTSFAKVGEIIKLTITADESITSPTVEFTINEQSVADANSVTVTGNGTTYIAEYTISSSDVEGLVGFTISSYTDLARNNGPTVSATTDSSQVTVDNTLPTLTTVSIASNNSVSNTAAKSNDKITLTIEASEDITAPTVTMNSGGQGLANTVNVSQVSGNSYEAEFTVDSGDRDGNCTFTISGYEDNAGNAGLGVTAVTDGTSVKVDNTPPKVYTTSLDPTSVGASGTLVTVTFTEVVSGFALDDVTANEGVVSDLNTDDNITYTFKYTPNSNYSATSNQKIIEIGTNYVDLADNQAVSSAPINSILTTAATSNPIENIILSNINSDIDPVVLTSSNITTVVTTTGLPNNIDAEIVQTVTGVELSDLEGATKTQLISQLEDEYANYQLNIAPERVSVALTSGSVIITTTIASVDAVTGSAITVDSTGPNVIFFSYAGNSLLKKGETALITISFSEAVDNFTNDTIVAPDATVSGLSNSNNAALWNFYLTAKDDVESTNNVITILGTYTDLVGNSGTEFISSNSGVIYSVDTLSPTPTITASNTTIQDTETADITITFNEAVNGFNNDDVTVTNGTITTLTSTNNNKTWTATFTPTTAGVAQIQVNSGSYFDSALNQGTAASLTITVQGEVLFTDEPNECLPDSLNNNTLTGVKSMPLKDGSSNNDASFALGRKQHTSRMLFTNSNTTTKLTKKWSYNRDASSVIARRKAGSMGASLNKTGGKISFTSPNDHNTVDRALQRVRAGGAVVPKKSANNK